MKEVEKVTDDRLLSFYRKEKQWLEETASSDSKFLSAMAMAILKRGKELEELRDEVREEQG